MKYYRDNEVLKQFGDKVRAIRLSKKMSQEDLAYESGLEYSQINRIELGKIKTSISHLFIIAKALNVTPQDLINFSKTYSATINSVHFLGTTQFLVIPLSQLCGVRFVSLTLKSVGI